MTGSPDWRISDGAGERRLDPAGVTVIDGDGWRGRYERVSFGPGFHMHLGELDIARSSEQRVAAADDAPPVISVYLPIAGRTTLEMVDWPVLALEPGVALLFTAKERRSIFRHPGKQTFRFFSVAVSPDLFASLLDDPLPASLAPLLEANGRETVVRERPVSASTRALVAELGPPGDGGRLQRLHREAVALRLLTEVIGGGSEAQAEPLPAPRDIALLRAARVDLLTDLREPPTAAELARGCGMGLRRFLRTFEAVHGASPAQLLRTERLDRARQMIEAGDATLKQVAWQVGYGHVSNFVAAFSSHFGLAPRHFRRGDQTG